MERKDKLHEIEDIERLLSPKCDFHTSAGFRDRVMKVADKELNHRRRRLIPWLISVAAAAAVVALVFTLLPALNEKAEKPHDKLMATASLNKSEVPWHIEINEMKVSTISKYMNETEPDFTDARMDDYNEKADDSRKIEHVEDISEQAELSEDEGVAEFYPEKEDLDFQGISQSLALAQINDDNSEQISGPLPIQTSIVSGSLPVGFSDIYGFNPVVLSRNEHLDYIERIRMQLEEIDEFMREVYPQH